MSTLTKSPTGLPSVPVVQGWLEAVSPDVLQAALAWHSSRPVEDHARRVVNAAMGFGSHRNRMEDAKTRVTCSFRRDALTLARGNSITVGRLDEVVYHAYVVAILDRRDQAHHLSALGVHQPFLALFRLQGSLEADPDLAEYVVSLAGGWVGSLDDLVRAARRLR